MRYKVPRTPTYGACSQPRALRAVESTSRLSNHESKGIPEQLRAKIVRAQGQGLRAARAELRAKGYVSNGSKQKAKADESKS